MYTYRKARTGSLSYLTASFVHTIIKDYTDTRVAINLIRFHLNNQHFQIKLNDESKSLTIINTSRIIHV